MAPAVDEEAINNEISDECGLCLQLASAPTLELLSRLAALQKTVRKEGSHDSAEQQEFSEKTVISPQLRSDTESRPACSARL
jgi:hypothetical protein